MSVKKILDRERDWECVKEVRGCIINTEVRTFAPPERNLQELWDLLDIPISKQLMGRKEMERLLSKLCSMHLAVPGAVVHIYHIHLALYQAVIDRTWLSSDFHHKLVNWKILTYQTTDRRILLVEIFRCGPTHMGFCDASGLWARGVWLYTSRLVKDMVWGHPWPAEIISELVSSTNREGTITNSNLELAALLLHEFTLLI